MSRVQVKVKSNIKKFMKGMDKKQREQMPFVAQQSFKQTAFDMRKYFVDKTFPNAFKTGNAKNFARAVLRVDTKQAKKVNFKVGNMKASIYDSTNKDYLLKQEKGGFKVPKKGKTIAVPTPAQAKKLGKRRKHAQRPQQILQKKNVRIINVEKGKSHKAIVQGTKKKSKRLFHLVPFVRVKPILNFEKDGIRITRKLMNRYFAINFRRAMKSAR